MQRVLAPLQITDLAMLARAAAIDQASHDLLADASATARRQDIVGAVLPRHMPNSPGRPAVLASKDLPAPPNGAARHASRQADATAASTAIGKQSARFRTSSVPR